ncbi:MAG: hypothetical protein IJZ15_02400 [Oscillospiraceae bacterium]|nr:hypothetical protein [Oscillospiraceae bacterium]
MKKVKRIVSLVAALAMCLSLCGCVDLDELRTTRATVTEEGNIKLYDGTEYILLPECEALSPSFYEGKMVYVAQEEIPLLLTSTHGDGYSMSDDGVLLESYIILDDDIQYIYYCRADMYDSLLERIVGGFTPEVCCYWCYDYNLDEMVSYTLTQDQVDAINQVCATQEPQILPQFATMDWEYWASLYWCSADMLFEKEMVDICLMSDTYYVMEPSGDDTLLYTVPEGLNATFAAIMELQIESDSYWEEW